jgi:hypothetical protein
MVNWRDIGDVPLEVYEAEFERLDSPMLPYAREVYEAARPHSALLLAKMFHEQKYATWNNVIPADYHNPCSLAKPKGTPADGVNRWERYGSWAEGVRACRERITSETYKDGVYARTVTVADLIRVFAPPSENDTDHYIDVVNALLQKWSRIPQEATVADRPSILLTRGHGTTGDTGAFAAGQSEETQNKRIVPAIARVLREAGYAVTTFPADPTMDVPGTLDTEGAYARDWMAKLGGKPGVMLDCHLESSAASGIFAIVPNLAHLVTGAPVQQNQRDQWANNVGDRALGKRICEEISQLTGMPIRTAWVREPGLMSEDMTWVGQGGGGAYWPSRLAMFGYTSPFCDTVYRLVVEFGALQSNAGIFTRADFPDQAGRGVLAALNAVFGAPAKPEPPKVEPIGPEVRHAFSGSIIREAPTTESRVKAQYKKRTALKITGKAKGQKIRDSDEWFQITSKGPSNKGFIHLSGLERVETV